MTSKRREGLLPTRKRYSLVEVPLGSPVEEAAAKLMEFDDPDDVSIPPDTPFEFFVVYDRDGNEIWVPPRTPRSAQHARSTEAVYPWGIWRANLR